MSTTIPKLPEQALDIVKYKTLLEKHGATRHKLNTDLWKRYDALNQVFSLVYGVPRKYCNFKFVADLDYYEGGYPNPSSPAKLDVFARQIATTFAIYAILDRTSDLNKRLAAFGIRVSGTGDSRGTKEDSTVGLRRVQLDTKAQKKFSRLWQRAFDTTFVPTDDRTFLALLLTKAEKLQHEICQLADTIKIGGAKEAKEKHGIEKSNFKIAVGIEASRLKQAKKKDIALANVKEKKIKNLGRAIIPFEDKP